jgi:hypothetical protein
MRKASGFLLVGLGLFATVLAILLPTVVVSKSKKTPLDLDITQRAIASNAKVLDASGKLQTVTLRATRLVKTDSHASDDTNTTVFETLCVVIVQGKTPDCVKSPDPRLLSVTTDRVTADRVSAESVHVAKWHENVNGQPARHSGLTYKWPIDTKKKDYTFYMPDLLKAFPAKYEGTDKIDGLTVYKFSAYSGVQPYKVLGLFDGTYEDTTLTWVEPLTGAVIYGEEHQVQRIKSDTDPNGTLALDATFKFDKKSVDFQANYSKDEIDKLHLAQLWAPLGLAVVALASFVGAYFLLRRRRAGGDDPQRPGRHAGPTPDDDPDRAEPPVWAGSTPGAPGGGPAAPTGPAE